MPHRRNRGGLDAGAVEEGASEDEGDSDSESEDPGARGSDSEESDSDEAPLGLGSELSSDSEGAGDGAGPSNAVPRRRISGVLFLCCLVVSNWGGTSINTFFCVSSFSALFLQTAATSNVWPLRIFHRGSHRGCHSCCQQGMEGFVQGSYCHDYERDHAE